MRNLVFLKKQQFNNYSHVSHACNKQIVLNFVLDAQCMHPHHYQEHKMYYQLFGENPILAINPTLSILHILRAFLGLRL